jgi:hypothetical protein
MVASIPKSYQVEPKFWLHGYIKHPSEHLEYRIEPQVLDWLALGKFRRFAIWYLLARHAPLGVAALTFLNALFSASKALI